MSEEKSPKSRVGAVVLAAGLARRMGQPKVLLAWEAGSTILDHILKQLQAAGVEDVVVVTGHEADKVREIVKQHGITVVHNPDYATGEMLSSLKTGLRALPDNVTATLVVLGDQPRIQPEIVRLVMQAYAAGKGRIVAPSYEMRRGHPILIDRQYWNEILALPADGAPRDVINAHADQIAYVVVDTDSVLGDVDTPEDYEKERRRAGLA
jgi:molybdenum cofactor cytidylyltransferase